MKQIGFIVLFCLSISVFGQTKKGLKELVDPENTKWETISKWISVSKTSIEVLPKNPQRADSAILQSQITTFSVLGSVIHNCGGILIDHGFVRLLGSGCAEMNRSIPQWNKGKAKVNAGDFPTFVLIGDDAIGGLFAINAGGLDEINLNKVFYFGPNSLRWECLRMSYDQFLVFCMSDDIRSFYSDFKWKDWESEVKSMSPDQAVSCYPLLWTRDGKELKRNRKKVPIQKLWEIYASKNKSLTATVNRSYSFKQ